MVVVRGDCLMCGFCRVLCLVLFRWFALLWIDCLFARLILG